MNFESRVKLLEDKVEAYEEVTFQLFHEKMSGLSKRISKLESLLHRGKPENAVKPTPFPASKAKIYDRLIKNIHDNPDLLDKIYERLVSDEIVDYDFPKVHVFCCVSDGKCPYRRIMDSPLKIKTRYCGNDGPCGSKIEKG